MGPLWSFTGVGGGPPAGRGSVSRLSRAGGAVIAVDLFAGLGGWTVGAQAAGWRVAWAANHWPTAVEYHARNHPQVQHVCQDLRQADWSRLPPHDVLIAAPACQGHSRAGRPGRAHGRGRAVRHDEDRASAWAVIDALDACGSPFALVENVPEFRRWRLYGAWRGCLERLGYAVEEHVINAADLGAPQDRARLFVVARRGRRPLRLTLPRRTPAPISSVLRLADGPWAPIVRPGRGAGVLRRVARARSRGLGGAFLVQHVTGHPGRSLARPIGTLTTKDQWAIVRGHLMRPLLVEELLAAMTFPSGHVLPRKEDGSWHRTACHRLLGNAVAPLVAEEVCRAVERAA